MVVVQLVLPEPASERLEALLLALPGENEPVSQYRPTQGDPATRLSSPVARKRYGTPASEAGSTRPSGSIGE